MLLHSLFALFTRIWLFPLYFLSGLCKRRDDLWVFGSWGGYRYTDNAAAFYQFCREEIGQEITLVWISRRRTLVAKLRAQGCDAEWIWSVRGVIVCLRAGVYVFDCFSKDVNYWLSRRAKKVNLWSGVPLKTFERDIDNKTNRYYRLFHGVAPERWLMAMLMPWHLDRPDLIIATSRETAEITCRAFALTADKVAVTGFPRNDVLFDPPDSPDRTSWPPQLIAALEAGKKVFLYLPTFRDSGKSSVYLDWAALEHRMSELDAMLFIKLHPVDRSRVDYRSSRIDLLPQDIDLYSILPYMSALISDYSSVIFDFMLLDRPILYYVPDLESFIAGERALNFDPTEVAVGPVCHTFAELLTAITDTSVGRQLSGQDRRSTIMPRLHAHVDGGSCRRVLQAIGARLPNDSPANSTTVSTPAKTTL